MIVEMLEAEGYSAAEASDGSIALELAERLRPAAILLDLSLPGLSGVEVLRQLKVRRSTHQIPVLVVSAYAILMRKEDMQRADGLIQKPFDLAELLVRVEQIAGSSQVPSAHNDASSRLGSRRPRRTTREPAHGGTAVTSGMNS